MQTFQTCAYKGPEHASARLILFAHHGIVNYFHAYLKAKIILVIDFK